MQTPYHVGIVVPRLDESMALLSAVLGTGWSDVQERGPADGQVRVVYSQAGPPYLELIEDRPGSVWESGGELVLHHLGYWCDDLDATTRGLADEGYAVEADFGHARYLVAESAGPRIEIVARSALPQLAALFGITG